MHTSHVLGVTLLSALALAMPKPVIAQTVVPLAPFRSVELRNGGKAILRHGPVQRVTLLKGTLDYSQVTIVSGDRLVIDKCSNKCPRGYELEIEIITPDIYGISVAHGGTIASRGNFPRLAEIRIDVSNGGTIDIRSITVDSVNASVDQGGRIFTKPQVSMSASVRQGGIITYWGDAQVTSSVEHGGVVTKGTAEEADQPISDIGPSLPSVPQSPITPTRPIQPITIK